jgi:hypothetical protein
MSMAGRLICPAAWFARRRLAGRSDACADARVCRSAMADPTQSVLQDTEDRPAQLRSLNAAGSRAELLL